MRLIRKHTVFALGFFDGVHLGHQALLKACRELAEKHGCRVGVVTFISHPDALVLGKAPVLLNTREDRKQLLQAFGVEEVWEFPFNKETMSTFWADFLDELVRGGAEGFVCGEDFRFGAGGNGTAQKLAAFCKVRDMPCAIIPEQVLDGARISSTHIRKLLEDGNVIDANRFLGHPHILSGPVVPGRQLGRTIGIPTANLTIPDGVLIPKRGVYATRVTVDGKTYPAVTNIGTRPTVAGDSVTVESYLLDFSGDLYGKEIRIFFLGYLREEKRFSSQNELIMQINVDKNRAIKENGELTWQVIGQN
jgi:riboflavin kinase/FMN adenylyltransferase